MEPYIILVIEDEQLLSDTLRLKLTKEGFAVETVSDGKDAVAKALAVHPNIILLDLVLPRVSGQELLAQFKKDPALKDIPVIIISNSGQPVELKELLRLGAEDYIIKADFTIDDIMERVYNVIEKKKHDRPDVLIAEDEAFLRIVLAKKLRLTGLSVITCIDGDSTLLTILQTKPKIVLLDLLMPGISGVEVLKALEGDARFSRNDTKIIVLSNYSGKEYEEVIKRLADGYLIKSNFDIDDIAEKVKGYL